MSAGRSNRGNGRKRGGRKDQEGDPERVATFERLYERWRSVVYEQAWRVLGSDSDAEDVVQQVFARLLESGGWREISSPASYFASAGRKTALNLRSRLNRHVLLPSFDLEPLLGSADEIDGRQTTVRHEAFNRLITQYPFPSRKCAAVMKGRYLEDLSRRQMAAKLDMSVNAVEQQITRGHRAMRDQPNHHLVQEWASYFYDEGG